MALAKLKDLTSLNFNPGAQREFCLQHADMYGQLGEQETADAWMMVASMIAAGKSPPNEKFETRVVTALRASSESLARFADVVEREMDQRTANVQKSKSKAAGKAGEAAAVN
jgi:hypothetical protein